MRGHRWADEPASFADMQSKVPRSVGLRHDRDAHLRGPWVMGAGSSEPGKCPCNLTQSPRWRSL
jgi:hypothetical protein